MQSDGKLLCQWGILADCLLLSANTVHMVIACISSVRDKYKIHGREICLAVYELWQRSAILLVLSFARDFHHI